MSHLLSQDEIDSLLGGTAARARTADAAPESSIAALPYNFRRQDRITKEQLRSLQLLHDRFSLNVSTSLSAFLRALTEVTLASVEQISYSEFLMSLPDPTAFYAVGLAPLDGMAALEINPVVAFAMVDRMLGGVGQAPAPNRALTEIEQNVLDSVVKVLFGPLTETWRSIAQVAFNIQARETRPQMLQITGQNEIVILLAFDLRLGEAQGRMHLCIPAAAIESMEDTAAQGWHRTRREPTAAESWRLETNLGRIPLSVTTLLETRLPARELLALRPGDVVALAHPVSKPVDVQVGRVRRYWGRLMATDGHASVVIERVSNERHTAIGGPQ